eukprot:Rhum_TRINITY_DN9265_c0_g1::Rhum_TRINITY_DN9265_c0_g1_i1::g.32597::m.32597
MNFLKKGAFDLLQGNPFDGNQAALGGMSEGEYEDRACETIPGDVFMFSGCMDSQTSADVSNVASFGLPPASGPEGAGGACTNALLSASYGPGEESWVELLEEMRAFLQGRGYSQIPQLSTSRKMDLRLPFEIAGGYGGQRKALMVGINYSSHSQGQLSGCINDVCSMANYITRTEGFGDSAEEMMVLCDDEHDPNLRAHVRAPVYQPTRDNILRGIDWLVGGAQAGDVLFFHYSGHGGQKTDDQWDGDEEDGKDETLIPVDYREAGQITDDELFQRLVERVPLGVRLVCLMDCCHSGTILDLPYTFTATDSNIASAGSTGAMMANPSFAGQIKKFLTKVGSGNDGILGMAKQFGFF